jgi:hypothetical protein
MYVNNLKREHERRMTEMKRGRILIKIGYKSVPKKKREIYTINVRG